ncbi:MAG: NAD-dependent epimerase/dehydratase family protein [Promethearchaeati archaeon SRVP18_Atabeyarchaeia-1]
MEKVEGKRVLVTGGCGFIGSHLVDALIGKENEVTILDNLSSSTLEYVKQHIERKRLRFVKGDVKDVKTVAKLCSEKDAVFHFAAQPDVRLSLTQPLEDFETNVKGTLNVLEGVRKGGAPLFIFASTSTVYGQASVMPTPESCPIAPISNYGASKSACETYMMAYSSCYGIKCVSLRYANIFGDRSNHGVVYDFFMKLKRDPRRLEILGDGKQKKSYLYISDCIDASMHAAERHNGKGFEAFNIGSNEQIEVNEIADIVIEQLGISGVELSYTGGKAGWLGDVTDMLLDTTRIMRTGWQPKVDTRRGIQHYITWMKEQLTEGKTQPPR